MNFFLTCSNALNKFYLLVVRIWYFMLDYSGHLSRSVLRQANEAIVFASRLPLWSSMQHQSRLFSNDRVAIMLLFFLIASFNLNAQGMFEDISEVFNGAEVLYGALVVIGGYLSAFIPGLNTIDKGVYRVLAWAILTGIGFALFGMPILTIAVTYAVSTSLYEVVFRLFKRSPNPTEA